MNDLVPRRINITDQNIGLTFSGEVKSFKNQRENIIVLLQNVTVYEYVSSNYLYQLPEITLSGPSAGFHIEEIS